MTILEPAPIAADPSRIPGAMQEVKRRELIDGSEILFEFAPYGWLTQDGEPRQKDHRAYWYLPQPQCLACEGSGRAPSEKRPDGTVKCKPCNGTGECKRERMVSVTTLLDSISPKPGIPPWSEARGIEGTIEALRRGEITADTDPADAVKIVRYLKLGADRARDTAADRGLNVHALLEDYMLTGTVPNLADHPVEHHGYVQGLCGFLLKNDPEPIEVEQLVCDPDAGYAGRRDLVAMVGGCRVGVDLKTSANAGIFSSSHLQLRLYEQAAIACGDEPCDRLEIVVVAENGEFRVMPCEATTATAAQALEFYRAVKPIDSLCSSMNQAEKRARR